MRSISHVILLFLLLVVIINFIGIIFGLHLIGFRHATGLELATDLRSAGHLWIGLGNLILAVDCSYEYQMHFLMVFGSILGLFQIFGTSKLAKVRLQWANFHASFWI